jgi:hypothetical protein
MHLSDVVLDCALECQKVAGLLSDRPRLAARLRAVAGRLSEAATRDADLVVSDRTEAGSAR